MDSMKRPDHDQVSALPQQELTKPSSFVSTVGAWKREGERTPQNPNNQKAPEHPEGFRGGSWLSEDILGSYIQLLNQTVQNSASGCTAKETAYFPDPDTPYISFSLFPTFETRYMCSVIFKEKMKPNIFSKMQVL